MANQVTILSIDDVTGNVLVLFEDDASGLAFQTGIYIPEEFADEAAVLDYVATFWPHGEFAREGKDPADRHIETKKIIGISKNITSRIQSP